MQTTLNRPSSPDDLEFHRLTSGARRHFDPWEAIRRTSIVNALIAVAIAVAAAVLVMMTMLNGTPRYVSTATLLIDQPQAVARSTDEGVIRKLNLLRLKYIGLIPTSAVAVPLGRELGLHPGHVASVTGGYVTGDALVLHTWAADRDPAEARRISSALAAQVVRYADDEQTANGIPADAQFRLRVVADAGPAQKTDPRWRTAAQAAVAAAVLVAATAYVALQLLTADRRR